MRRFIVAAVSVFAITGLTLATFPAAAFDVNTTQAGNQVSPAIANFKNGSFVVVWNSSQGAKGIFGQRYNSKAVKIGGEFEVDTSLFGEGKPAVATFDDSSFVAIWYATSGTKGVYGQLFAPNGTKAGAIFKIAADASTTDGATLDVAVNKLQQFVVVWEKGGATSDINAQRFSKAGVALGGRIVVSAAAKNQFAPVITALDNNYVILWTTLNPTNNQTTVWAQRYSAGGVTTGAPIRVHSKASGNREGSNVAALPNGGFLAVWAEYSTSSKLNVHGQRFKANGARNGVEFFANTESLFPATGTYIKPGVVVLKNGNFVVSWDGNKQPKREIIAQRYLATGAKFSANFTVAGSGDQAFSALGTAVGPYGFVAIWEGRDNNGRGIKGRTFDQ
jgi:hypothetical protein